MSEQLKQQARTMAQTIGHGGSATLRRVASMIDAGNGADLSYVAAECLRLLAEDFDIAERTARGINNVLQQDRKQYEAELRELRNKVERQQRDTLTGMREPLMLIIMDEADEHGVDLALELIYRLDGDPVR